MQILYNDGDSEELREQDARALLVDVVAIQNDDGEQAELGKKEDQKEEAADQQREEQQAAALAEEVAQQQQEDSAAEQQRQEQQGGAVAEKVAQQQQEEAAAEQQRQEEKAAAVASQVASQVAQQEEGTAAEKQRKEEQRPFHKDRKQFPSSRTKSLFTDLVEATKVPRRQSDAPQLRRERHRKFCSRESNVTQAAPAPKCQNVEGDEQGGASGEESSDEVAFPHQTKRKRPAIIHSDTTDTDTEEGSGTKAEQGTQGGADLVTAEGFGWQTRWVEPVAKGRFTIRTVIVGGVEQINWSSLGTAMASEFAARRAPLTKIADALEAAMGSDRRALERTTARYLHGFVSPALAKKLMSGEPR